MKNKQSNIENCEQLGRITPQAREPEEAVLGAVLLEKTAFETANHILLPEMFYDKANELIYAACAHLEAHGRPIDMLTVIDRLRQSGDLEKAGGYSRIAQLSQKVVSSAHLEYHARIVAQKYIARKAIEYLSEAVKFCFDETSDIDDVLSEVSGRIEKLQESAIGKSEVKQLREVMRQSVKELYERKEKYEKGLFPGIHTGLADLNRITGGWQKSNLVILAGRPSMGKTSIALHFAKSAAKHGTPVVIFELEMSDVKLSDRLLLSESNIDPNNFKTGRVTQEDVKSVEIAVGRLYDYKIHIDSNPMVTMDYIRNRCRLLKKQGKCEMAVIDYLQLIEDSGNKNSVREQEVARMSRKAKLLAKELDIPVLLLAQLSRKVEDRSCKKPMLSDLRESGAIEQDADLVIFVYREEYYNPSAAKGRGNLIIAKYRDGYTGEIDFACNESMTKIFDVDKGDWSKSVHWVNPPENGEIIPF
jgi:replicative DNA helicase